MFSVDVELLRLPHWLSLGAGVQSSTLALMFAAGEVSPMPDGAVFADTCSEPASVYRWLDWLESQLPFPVHRVSAGDLGERAVTMKVTEDGRRFSLADVPVFTRDVETGKVGMVQHRGCTRDFKIRPVLKFLRAAAKIQRGESQAKIVSAIGISLDEAIRMKPSRDKWVANRWPLVELRMTRLACLEWMRSRGFPTPPRSACVFCPYHSNAEWRRLKQEEPEAFLSAVEFERSLQAAKSESANYHCVPYLHKSCVPLDQVDFRNDVDRGQQLFWQDECEGMCGI
jgi:hypothetical protein